MGTEFHDFMREIHKEAERAGPEAVAQLEQLHMRYRLGVIVTKVRLDQSLSQKQMAELVGTNLEDWINIERGVVDIEFNQNDKGWVASVPSFVGAYSQGRSKIEAYHNLCNAFKDLVEAYCEY